MVTTRYNGASERLGDPPAGAVVRDPHDDAGLAKAIEDVLHPAHRARLAERATAAAAAWTFEDHYRALVAVFEQVRDRKRSGGAVW